MTFPIYTFQKKVNVTIPTAGLVAEYLGNNNFLDTSGNGYNGVNNNVTFGNDRHGVPNSSFVFNGTNAFINIDSSLAGLSTTTKGTWSSWIKPVDATPTSHSYMISFGDTDANERLTIDNQTSGKLRAISVTLSGVVNWVLITDNVVFSDGTWAHIAITQNAINPILYIDGVVVDQTFIVSADKTTWFNDHTNIDNGRIGNENFFNAGEIEHFEGSMDDIRAYNRDLSQEEITQLFNE